MLLLLLFFVTSAECQVSVTPGCAREREAGKVFRMTGAYDTASVTPDICQEACAGLNDPNINAAGLTEGKICLCGVLTGK